ncbi:MAG: FtsX-like permease family protein [Streptosporangiaceae bacterium]
MTGWAVLMATSRGAARRRVQTAVLFVVLLAASASATLGLPLYTSANEVFQDAFATYHGAHLAVYLNAKRVTPQEVERTARLSVVTLAAGPYPATTVTLAARGKQHTNLRAGVGLPTSQTVTVAGRASLGGPLDDLTLYGGRWPAATGEIALALYADLAGSIGSTVTASGLTGQPRLLVVGEAGSVVRDEDAWTTPGEISALVAAGAPAQDLMLFTFRNSATAVEVSRDLKAIEGALPKGAVVGSVSWLLAADQIGSVQSIDTPFVLAFALFAIALAALVTAAVVSGVVVAGYRRIGVLKSIGFTPSQVTAAYLLQVAVPAVLGCVAGVVLGRKWVYPMIYAGDGHRLPRRRRLAPGHAHHRTVVRQDGEVDVSHQFLTQTGLAVGNELTLSVQGRLIKTTIVGEAFAPVAELFAGSGTFPGTELASSINQYQIRLISGTGASAYVNRYRNGWDPPTR